MSSVLIGKIVEFKLPIGYAYGLCTHDLKNEGHVIQLYKDFYDLQLEAPETTLASAFVRTLIKFPLKYVLKEPEIQIVGAKILGKREKERPIFRSLGLPTRNDRPTGWWIIDGAEERWVDALTQEMAHYPDDGLYSLGAIQELFEQDLYPHSASCLERGPLAFKLTQLQ